MKKQLRGYEVVLGILIAVALAAIFQVLAGPTHDTSEILGVKRGEWLLFLATVALWISTQNLVRGAATTAERELRPYVGVTSQAAAAPVAGQQHSAGLFLTNYGQTPALKIRYWGNVIIQEWPLTSPLPERSFGSNMLPINPAQKVPVHFTAVAPLTAQEGADFRAGSRAFYFYGKVEYQDGFEQTRTTYFRFEYAAANTALGQWVVSGEDNNNQD